MRPILLAPIMGLILWALRRFALPFARLVARRWVWLHTRRLPTEVQEAKAADAAAFYYEWEGDLLKQGHNAGAIGPRLLVNVIRGVWGDVMWRWEIDLGAAVAATIAPYWGSIYAWWKRLDPWVTRISLVGVASSSVHGLVIGDYSTLILYAQMGAIGLAVGMIIGCIKIYREQDARRQR